MYLIPKSHSYFVTDLGFERSSVLFQAQALYCYVLAFLTIFHIRRPLCCLCIFILFLCPLPVPLASLVIPHSSSLNLNISFPERPLPKKDLYKIEPTHPPPPAKKDQSQSIIPYCIFSLLQGLPPPKLISFIFFVSLPPLECKLHEVKGLTYLVDH